MNPNSDTHNFAYQLPDITDTGEWRLIIYLGKGGISAWIKSTEDLTAPVRLLFTSDWQPSDEGLLHRIENAVYDHPRVLDDFSADIIVETEKALWVPKEMLGEHPEAMCEKWVEQVWPGMASEFQTDDCGDKFCLYLLTPGLRDFLGRTFPGTRVTCHQTQLVRNLAGRAADDTRMYIDIRQGEADILIFSGKNLLNATTREWHSEADIAWHAFNLMEVYGIDPKKAQVCLSGLRETRENLAREMRRYLAFVMLTMVPKVESETPMPLVATFCAARNNSINLNERKER